MKALILGSMGLIGRSVSKTLKDQGHEVHGCDLKWGRDCRETFEVNNIHYDLVVHAAGSDLPAQRTATNIDFFKWLDKVKPDQVVYISSEHVYPKGLQQSPYRLKESDAKPDSTMGQIDRESEQMALERGAKVFRPFQVYGPGGHGIYEAIWALIEARPYVLSVPACGQVFDFIHVSDVVGAILKSLDMSLDGPVNLCTGEPTPVDELAMMVCRAIKYEPKRLVCDPKEEQFFRCGDPTLMNRIRPATIPLSRGILCNLL